MHIRTARAARDMHVYVHMWEGGARVCLRPPGEGRACGAEAAAAVDIVAVKEVTPMVIQLAEVADQRTPDQTNPIPQMLGADTVR